MAQVDEDIGTFGTIGCVSLAVEVYQVRFIVHRGSRPSYCTIFREDGHLDADSILSTSPTFHQYFSGAG